MNHIASLTMALGLAALFSACAQKNEPAGSVSRRAQRSEAGTLHFQWKEENGSVVAVTRRMVAGGDGLALEAPVTYLGEPPAEVEISGAIRPSSRALLQGVRQSGENILVPAQDSALPVMMSGVERTLRISFLRVPREEELRAVATRDPKAPRLVSTASGTWHFAGAVEWSGGGAETWLEWGERTRGGFLWPRRWHRTLISPCDFQTAVEELPPWMDGAEFRVLEPRTPEALRSELSRDPSAYGRAKLGRPVRLWIYARGSAPERAFSSGQWRQGPQTVKAYRPYTVDMKNAEHPWEARQECSAPAFGGAAVGGVFLVANGEEVLAPLMDLGNVEWRLGAVAEGRMQLPFRELRAAKKWPVQER